MVVDPGERTWRFVQALQAFTEWSPVEGGSEFGPAEPRNETSEMCCRFNRLNQTKESNIVNPWEVQTATGAPSCDKPAGRKSLVKS